MQWKIYLTKFGKDISCNLVILSEKKTFTFFQIRLLTAVALQLLWQKIFLFGSNVNCELTFQTKCLNIYIEKKNILFITNYAIFCELIWHQALLHVKEICLTSSITRWNGPFGIYYSSIFVISTNITKAN